MVAGCSASNILTVLTHIDWQRMCVFDYPPKKAIGLYCFNLLGNLFQATSTDQRIACSFEPPGITKQERDHQFASNIGFWGFLGPRKSLVEPPKSLAEPRKSLVEPRGDHALTFFLLEAKQILTETLCWSTWRSKSPILLGIFLSQSYMVTLKLFTTSAPMRT